MPSLILKQIDKSDDRRKDETEDWIEKLESRFEIEKRKYINIEVVFRQLVMHEKMATGFVYENDEPFPLNKNLKENIERHLGRIRSKNNYGFHRLTFEKKDRIKSAEQTLKSHHADINKLKELSASLRLSGSLITIEPVSQPDRTLGCTCASSAAARCEIPRSLRTLPRFLANGLDTLFRAGFFFAKDELLHHFCRLKKNHSKINSVNRTYAVNRIFNERVDVGTVVDRDEPNRTLLGH